MKETVKQNQNGATAKPNELAHRQSGATPSAEIKEEVPAPLCSVQRPCSDSFSFVSEPQSDDLVNCGTLSLGKADEDGLFRLSLIKKDVRQLINILRVAIGDDKESAYGKAHDDVNNYLIQQSLPPLVPLS